MGGWEVMQGQGSQPLQYANEAGFWSKDLQGAFCCPASHLVWRDLSIRVTFSNKYN